MFTYTMETAFTSKSDCLLYSSIPYGTAEFVIMLAEKSSTEEKFKTALMENGAEFPVCAGTACCLRSPLCSIVDFSS